MEIYLTFLKLHTNKPSVTKLSCKSGIIIISNVSVSLLGFWAWGSVPLQADISNSWSR